MNTYSCSCGTRLKESVIKELIKKAKKNKLLQQFDEHGYNFCEDCGRSTGTPLDCSHSESVKSCKENGRTEKAFDVKNIKIRCRGCHQKLDGLGLKFSKD